MLARKLVLLIFISAAKVVANILSSYDHIMINTDVLFQLSY